MKIFYAIFALVALFVFIGIGSLYMNKDNSVSVNNVSGSIKVETNSAKVSFSIEGESNVSNEEAVNNLKNNEAGLNEIFNKNGISKDLLKLENFSSFNYSQDENEVFVAKNNYTINFSKENFEKMYNLVYEIASLNGANFDNIEKNSAENYEELFAKAQEKAIENGMIQGQKAAEKAGAKLGKIKYITLGQSYDYPSNNRFYAFANSIEKYDVEYFMSDTEVKAEVSLVFELK